MQKAKDLKINELAKTKIISRDEVVERFKKIKLLCLDMDGVLTDGAIIYQDDGSQVRNFNAKDGMGMVQLQREAKITLAVITGSESPLIKIRFKDRIKCKYVYEGVNDKAEALKEICDQEGIDLKDVCHVGDDVNDIPMFAHVGLRLTVKDAHKLIKERVDFITDTCGGKGAVREICDLIMEAQGVSYTGEAF